jgi:predicted transcriptional regulator
MHLTMTGAWLILGGLAFFLIFMAVLTAWNRRRSEILILLGLNAERFAFGPLETGEIAKRYGMSPEKTRWILENLFIEGWVVSHADERLDRYWAITDAGAERLKTVFPELRALDA